MIDGYFLKSLACTVALFLALYALAIAFVAVTGFLGLAVVLAVPAALLLYFYGFVGHRER